jgi:hypothetical protein
MEKHEASLLHDLLATYDMQIVAMKRAQKEGKTLTASLHDRMAQQLLDAYFEMVEKVLVD